MKPGDKYIIEIESVSKMPKGDIAFIKGFNALVFDQYGLDHLRRAEEISDAYKRGLADGIAGTPATPATKYEIDSALYLGHVKGMDEAWSMIRTMYSEMTIGTLRRIFNMQDADTTNIVMGIISAFPSSEVKKRLDAYEKEKEQKEKETKVPGDEVKYKLSDRTFVVTKVDGEFISGISADGSLFGDKHSCNWEKTGRHFDLSKLFPFMGGGDGA